MYDKRVRILYVLAANSDCATVDEEYNSYMQRMHFQLLMLQSCNHVAKSCDKNVMPLSCPKLTEENGMETEKYQSFYLHKNICHCLVFLRSERTDLRVNSCS